MLPATVPVRIEVRLVRNDGVVDIVRGAHGEVVAGTVIAIEVDHDIDAVDLILEILLYALPRPRYRRRLAISERHGQSVRCTEDPCLRLQGRGLPIERLRFAKIADDLRIPPFLGIDMTVDFNSNGRQGDCSQHHWHHATREERRCLYSSPLGAITP